jgi:hypothetical protein
MRGFVGATVAALVIVAGSWIAAPLQGAVAAVDPTPVLTGPNDEVDGVADAGYLAWAENRRKDRGHFDVFVKPAGQPRRRVNEPRTVGLPHSIELGGAFGNVLTFSEVKRSSDLKFYDLDTGDLSNPPGALNTSKDERNGTLSGDYILFQRDPARAPLTGRVILYDHVTDTSTVLGEAPSRGVVVAGRVNGDYATYYTCARACNAFRYQISTTTTTKIPNPGKDQYSPTPADDGSVYFVRTGNVRTCASTETIVRYGTDGSETVVSTLNGGRVVSGLYVYTEVGTPNVYFTRHNCRTGNDDVLDSVFT